jgi:hypothetical protein
MEGDRAAGTGRKGDSRTEGGERRRERQGGTDRYAAKRD